MIDLSKKPIIYITRDIERALGLDLDTPGYFIISNSTPFAKSVAEGHNNVLLIESDKQLDTWELLEHLSSRSAQGGEGSLSKTQKDAQKRDSSVASLLRNGHVVVFKPTTQIEKICQENNWKLLNPSAELSNKIEEKISGLEWLGDLQKYLPKNKVDLCKNISIIPFKRFWPFQHFKPFILQFNRAHTGEGTILIESESQLEEIKQKFPDRPVRITEYISGPMFTSNNVVTKNKILVGNISYQITGLKPFTDNPFTTIGNDWSFANKYLNEEQIKQYNNIVNDIGEKLRQDGWKGLFGVDIVVDETSGKLYLIEINARQPASTTYESQLQWIQNTNSTKIRNTKNTKLTTFEAHLLALQGKNLAEYELIKINDGAQIIQRVNSEGYGIRDMNYAQKLLDSDFNTITYPNTKPDADLIRIQSQHSLMKKHNIFNKHGMTIKKIIEN